MNCAPLNDWGAIETYDNQFYAGRVVAQVLVHQGFLRVSVPPTTHHGAFTKHVNAQHVRTITAMTEAEAREAAEQWGSPSLELVAITNEKPTGS